VPDIVCDDEQQGEPTPVSQQCRGQHFGGIAPADVEIEGAALLALSL